MERTGGKGIIGVLAGWMGERGTLTFAWLEWWERCKMYS